MYFICMREREREREREMEGGGGEEGPLFESRGAKGRLWYKLYAASVLVGIFLIWVYRAIHLPEGGGEGRLIWIGLFGAEIFFGLYWILTQVVRWNPIYHQTFKDRLSKRYENDLPPIDVFVCTADPTIEPPMLVINTVLSMMAFDYPTKKLSVYLSDDGFSQFTFYALLEAATFSKYWIPYCNKFKVEQSPALYFSSVSDITEFYSANEFSAIKKLYKEMESRVEATIRLGRISDELAKQEKGFNEWSSESEPQNHQPVVKILIDGRDPKTVDVEGMSLPTLVYVAREKRHEYPHNFKAGAINALIRVSSEISDAPFILIMDCDMYSNSSQSVRDAMCFFMDGESGHDIAFVQFPQNFRNLHKNNTYGDYITIVNEVEYPGFGQAMLMGTGCFHRRDSLCGRKYGKDYMIKHNNKNKINSEENASVREARAKCLASCTCEQKTEWGKNMGMMYGCPVEDVITGLSIQCRGWRSIYYNPPRKSFLGMGPLTLGQFLVQHKRWSEGLFQIFLSKYCPFVYGHGKIKLKLQLAYCLYLLWAPISLPKLYYVIVPSLCLLKGIPLFPKILSLWFIPFAYIITATQAFSLLECLRCGETFTSWWNMQTMKMMRRTTSYLFSFIDTILQQLGLGNSGFIITAKIGEDEALERYEKGIIEFGSYSPMFVVLAMIGVLNLICFVGGFVSFSEKNWLQFLLCGVLVIGNVPIYQALFFRKDKGSLPTSVAVQSALLAGLACSLFLL